MKLSTQLKEVTQLYICIPRIGLSWFPPLAPFGIPFRQPGAATAAAPELGSLMEADCGLHITDLAQGFHFPPCHFLLPVPIGQFAVAGIAHENRSIPTGMGVRPFIAAYFAGCRSHSLKSCGLGPPDVAVIMPLVFLLVFPYIQLNSPYWKISSQICLIFVPSVFYHRPIPQVGQEVTMTDNETTPEYGAWVEARRTAVEAQRADLEAAIRRLEESLAEARQDLLDFDGENYL